MDLQHIRQELKKWYAENKRILPWREISDPYKIWISEIILQQTRVAQGYDYYLRFIEKFPDVQTLAAASEDEVLRCWQGLGYYSRARNLHHAAQQIISDFNGHFPKEYKHVHSLKGIGDYTAAAICSFAYNLPYPVLDGNVFRVLSRLFGIQTPIDTTEGKKEFAQMAQMLMDTEEPAIYNQAIMEFGALQCTPNNAQCVQCPLLETCVAARTNTVNRLPAKANRTKVSDRYFNYLFFKAGKQTFLQKRGGNDIWKHLYELPLIEADRLLDSGTLLQHPDYARYTAHLTNPELIDVSKEITHVLSHQRIHTRFFSFTCADGEITSCCKIALADLEQYAVSRLTEKFLENHMQGNIRFDND